MGKPNTVKVKPATAMVQDYADRLVETYRRANAYPRLVEVLKTVAALRVDGMLTTGKPLNEAVTVVSALLRELGEES